MKTLYSREPKQSPKEIHHCGSFGSSFIQHENSSCVITIYKINFVVPDVTPTETRENSFTQTADFL